MVYALNDTEAIASMREAIESRLRDIHPDALGVSSRHNGRGGYEGSARLSSKVVRYRAHVKRGSLTLSIIE